MIVPNAWTNGPDQIECKERTDDTTVTVMSPDHGWGYQPPVIVCDELEDDFSLTVNVKLAWSNSKEAIQEENVKIFPNNPDNNANFKIKIPADIKSSKPEEWSSLTLQMMTKLGQGYIVHQAIKPLWLHKPLEVPWLKIGKNPRNYCT